MRCGICGNEKPTYGFTNFSGQFVKDLAVSSAADLVLHKRQQHPDEYAASQQKRKDTKAAHEQAERDYLRLRKEAGWKAGRTVLAANDWEGSDISVTTTGAIGAYPPLHRYRYPEPDALDHYYAFQEEITRLQERSKDALQRAYNTGTPVPQEDVDLVRAAMDAVPQPEHQGR